MSSGNFIYRTRENLRVIEDLAQRPNPQCGQVYEVTQLINSLLGLIVFPHEAFPSSIPDERLDDLAEAGWPKPRVVMHDPTVPTPANVPRIMSPVMEVAGLPHARVYENRLWVERVV